MKELGKKLREARIARKIDFQAIYQNTRIQVSTIQSIEQGRAGDLPETYYRAFVRAIAKEVGLNGDVLLKEMDARAEQKTDVENEHESQERFSFREFFKKNRRVFYFGCIGICVVVLIVLYFMYGKTLFYEPRLSDIPPPALPTDTLETGPFTIKVFALEDSEIEFRIDSSDSEVLVLKKGDETKWDVSRLLYLGMNDSRRILLYLNETPLTGFDQHPGQGLDLWIKMDGIVRQEIRRDVIKPVPKKEEKQPMPVILIGHLDEALLFRKVPVFKTNRDRYQPNPEILDQIKEIHPSLSLVCFMGTWDGVSQEVVPKLLKVVHEIALPGVTLTMIGVNQQLQDKVDLIEFYHVQGIPTILFLSRGTELGRIVGQPEESVEALFLDIVRKGDFL